MGTAVGGTAGGADEVLTIDELARYLKIAKSTLYKLAQEGKIPGQKVGRHWRFQKGAVDEWLARPRRAGRGRRATHVPTRRRSR